MSAEPVFREGLGRLVRPVLLPFFLGGVGWVGGVGVADLFLCSLLAVG